MSLTKSTFFLSEDPACWVWRRCIGDRPDASTDKSSPKRPLLKATRESAAIAATASSFMLFMFTARHQQQSGICFYHKGPVPLDYTQGAYWNRTGGLPPSLIPCATEFKNDSTIVTILQPKSWHFHQKTRMSRPLAGALSSLTAGRPWISDCGVACRIVGIGACNNSYCWMVAPFQVIRRPVKHDLTVVQNHHFDLGIARRDSFDDSHGSRFVFEGAVGR